MENSFHGTEDALKSALSALRPQLPEQDIRDIESFIGAGEYGVAADTLFCAVKDEHLTIDAEAAERLADIVGLFNRFGDLDPRIPDYALRSR